MQMELFHNSIYNFFHLLKEIQAIGMYWFEALIFFEMSH